jgi:DNA invertase Pin-like site-specific DNA recombinase
MLVGYARVSTLDQNPAMQEKALREAGCDRLYMETASGETAERPELRKALDYLRQGDCLVVWKLDRLGRSLMDLIKISSDMKERGILLRSLTEQIDTTTPTGMMFFHLIGAFAQMERELIKERTMAGLLRARALGRMNGRPRKLQGEKMKAAEFMLRAGKTYQQVAEALGVTRATVYRRCPWSKYREYVVESAKKHLGT